MFNRFFAFAAVALVSFSCGSSGGMDAGTDPELTCDTTAAAVQFSKVYADIFTPACISCHIAGAADGSASYGEYNTEAKAFAQVGKASLYGGSEMMLKVVEANNLGNSSMYLKVLGRAKTPGPTMRNLGGQMPLSAPALSAAQKKLLKDWICSGAKM